MALSTVTTLFKHTLQGTHYIERNADDKLEGKSNGYKHVYERQLNQIKLQPLFVIRTRFQSATLPPSVKLSVLAYAIRK